ncbi:glutamate ABC transporter substrate-binding protein [Kitasatospora cheerisanensis]|uniref:Putative ABC transporter substrate-binding protein n=1 Tax=Kitasatospora cheerisanensis KCTC 2395 TaxID=1348663 RepID=A0A066YS08_9ACTN|nr:glutamate ABC transporter substrate-binding protein [Kitasatospora cheerisanensis]KDN82759.1 putative ABC transporter substrate-binding protein [Kitasatospora cheerisanensis KCTC 2395]
MRTARSRILVAVTVLAAGLLGTGSADGAGGAAPLAAPQAAPQAPADTCDPTDSLPPRQSAGAKIAKIRERGTLVVGVDQNSYHWGFRNPQTGRIEGFDIDLAHAIAKSVLGDPDKVTLKTVPTARRVEAVKNGEVDLITRTMSITCERKKEIAFSVPYFRVAQRVVAPKAAHARTLDEALKGKRACVAQTSSSEAELKRNPHGTVSVVALENQLDCLVRMQLGEVEATLTDSELAAAQVAQDPMVELVGEPFLPAFMGVAMNQNDTDLIAWVNQVLADWRSGGGWRASYDTWLRDTMGAPDPYLP